jgi:hypothetical protein
MCAIRDEGSSRVLGCSGARVLGCSGARVLGCSGARVLGCSGADHMRTENVLDALAQSATTRFGQIAWTVFRTDRGSSQIARSLSSARPSVWSGPWGPPAGSPLRGAQGRSTLERSGRAFGCIKANRLTQG